jgi:Domain of unknown function (DUF4185)
MKLPSPRIFLVLCAAVIASVFAAGCEDGDDPSTGSGQADDDFDDDDTNDDDDTAASDDDTGNDDDASIDDDTILDDDTNIDDDTTDDDVDDDYPLPDYTYPLVGITVEDYNTYRLVNPWLPEWTGDLWPCAWGSDDSLYCANGDGLGFGLGWGDIVFNVIDGYPPDLSGTTPTWAYGPFIAHKWGPAPHTLSRKPTGLICVDGDIYMFYQNLSNFLSEEAFAYAPNASISMTPDGGETWEVPRGQPMFKDYLFTTGFFLDQGQCREYAFDPYIYVYGLDYNWRFSDDFFQSEVFLARVRKERLMDRSAWEFFTGMFGNEPSWSLEIEEKAPVITDETVYRNDKSGICQGSVVYLPQINRYIYSTRAVYEWIFWEAPFPWGPWTKFAVREWTGGWTPEFHAGYPTVIPGKFLDDDSLGGWIISSLSDGWFGGAFYNMGLRRFRLEADDS